MRIIWSFSHIQYPTHAQRCKQQSITYARQPTATPARLNARNAILSLVEHVINPTVVSCTKKTRNGMITSVELAALFIVTLGPCALHQTTTTIEYRAISVLQHYLTCSLSTELRPLLLWSIVWTVPRRSATVGLTPLLSIETKKNSDVVEKPHVAK